jgi:hypothetical protein
VHFGWQVALVLHPGQGSEAAPIRANPTWCCCCETHNAHALRAPKHEVDHSVTGTRVCVPAPPGVFLSHDLSTVPASPGSLMFFISAGYTSEVDRITFSIWPAELPSLWLVPCWLINQGNARDRAKVNDYRESESGPPQRDK